jgi:uncharacterized protein (TIGR03118 family)
MKMFPRHIPIARARARMSLFLVCTLVLSALPGLPAAVAAQAKVIADDGAQDQIQSIQIPVIAPGSAYRQTNFISDIPGYAPLQDPFLVNPWGISMTSSSPFWVANNATSTAQLIRGDVAGSPVVLNPSPQTVAIPGGLPTGTVANTGGATDFVVSNGSASGKAAFLFASITGNITGWNPNVPAPGSTTAQVAANLPGHVYTGLAIGSAGGNFFLYASDFANGKIDVFDKNFVLQASASFPFADPTIPTTSGNTYHPFNIQNIGGSLYVAYAKVGTDGKDEEGVGNGFVRRFNTSGVRDLTFGINNGPLNSPWGLTIAPATFGIFGGALLVGNFGDGNPSIHAFNPTTGAFLGTLQNEAGDGIEIDELWALAFGNGGAGGDPNTLYFTAGTGEEEHGLFGSLRPTTASATSLIQFSSDSFAIGEGSGHIDITVTRSGDASGTATVNYNTFDESQAGHASQKSDYEIALGSLTFAPGETSKTFRILLVNDNFVETGGETINLALSNPTGAGVGLGSPNVADVTITDNDAAPPTTNPIDDSQFFVRQHYLDLFNREPDIDFANRVAQITACGADAACIATKRVDVSNAFFSSPEYQGNGSLIIRTSKAAFGNLSTTLVTPGDVLYGQFELALQAILKDVAVGAAGASQLETNKQAFFNAFVQRPDFKAKYDALTNAQFVDALIANTGVTFTTAQRDQFVADLNSSAKSRAQVLRAIAENTTFAQQDANRDIVQLGFFGYLRRDPDTGQFNILLNRLNSLATQIDPRRDAVRLFINAPEYRQRFGVDSGPPASSVVNTAPVANNDTAATNSVTPVTINVLDNDTDINGDFLTIASVTAGTGGTPTISADKRSIIFTPAPGFAGAATFQYTITDSGTKLFPFTPLDDPKTASATVTVNVTSAGTFQFNAATAAVGEGAGKATITVTRAGDSSVPVTVDYATAPDAAVVGCSTVNGLASDRCDYNTAIGTLRFGAGETTKTFDIFITDDSRVEGNETFTVALSNPTGASFTLGGTTALTVTITDNDAAAGPNPIDGTPFFVREHYLDFLNREPDTAGFNAWVATINNCAANDTTCDRVQVSSQFFRSAEFQARGYFAIRFYRAAFGRDPSYREFIGDLSRLTGTTPAETSALNALFPTEFSQRAEFHTTFDSLTNAQYVDKLIANTGVTFTTAQRDQFVADLNSSAKSRAQVLRDVVEASVFVNNQGTFNRAFVLTEYFGYLRRDPDAGGFNNWLTFLNANPTNFRTMVNGFVNSLEYRLRFGAS